MTAGWFLFDPAYLAIKEMAQSQLGQDEVWREAFRNFTEAFFLKFKLSFYLGMILTLPFTVNQIWGFIAPGLKPHERKPIKVVAPVSFLLFLMGAGLCWLILPITIQWFYQFNASFDSVEVLQEPGHLIFFCVKMMLAFGVGFELPLVVFFLTKVGIITSESLLRYWRHCIFGVFLASALITPSGDPIAMSVMALPLSGLFFASVYVAKWSNRNTIDPYDELNNLD